MWLFRYYCDNVNNVLGVFDSYNNKHITEGDYYETVIYEEIYDNIRLISSGLMDENMDNNIY